MPIFNPKNFAELGSDLYSYLKEKAPSESNINAALDAYDQATRGVPNPIQFGDEAVKLAIIPTAKNVGKFFEMMQQAVNKIKLREEASNVERAIAFMQVRHPKLMEGININIQHPPKSYSGRYHDYGNRIDLVETFRNYTGKDPTGVKDYIQILGHELGHSVPKRRGKIPGNPVMSESIAIASERNAIRDATRYIQIKAAEKGIDKVLYEDIFPEIDNPPYMRAEVHRLLDLLKRLPKSHKSYKPTIKETLITRDSKPIP